MAGEARIVIRGDTDDAVKALKKVQSAVTDLDKQVTSKKSLFKDFLGGLGLGAGVFGAQAVASGFLNFGKASLSAAADLQALDSRARLVYGDAFPRMREQADLLGRAVGRSGSDMLEFETSFSGIASGLNIPRQAAEEMGDSLTKLTVDFGSFFNVADDEAFSLIQGGLLGMGRSLQRYGIVLNDTTLQEFAHSKGIKQKVSDLNEAQVTYLRYQFLLAKGAELEGNAAKNADSLANQTKKLHAEWKDLEENIGTVAIPVMGEAVKTINQTIGIVGQLGYGVQLVTQDWINYGRTVANVFGANLTTPSQLIHATRPQDVKGEGIAEGMARRQDELKQAGVAAADSDAKLRGYIDTLGKLGGGGGGGTADKAAEKLQKVRDAMEDVGRTYSDVTRSVSQDLKRLEQDHKEKMQGFADQIDDVTKQLSRLDEAYKETTGGIDRDEADAVSKQQKKVEDLKKQLQDEELKAYRENTAGSVSIETNDKLSALRAELASEQAALSALSPDLQKRGAAEGAKTDLQKDLEEVARRREQEKKQYDERKSDLEDEVKKLQEKKTQEENTYAAARQQYAATDAALESFRAGYSEKMQDIANVTEETAKQLKQNLEDIRNSISGIDASLQGNSEIGQRVNARRAARQIPALADGGIVDRPTIALIGESGPEAVVPLGKGSPGMGVSVVIQAMHVYKEADVDDVIRKITRAIRLQQLQSA